MVISDSILENDHKKLILIFSTEINIEILTDKLKNTKSYVTEFLKEELLEKYIHAIIWG